MIPESASEPTPGDVLRQLWQTVRAGLPLLSALVIVFALIGLALAFLLPEEFTSKARLLPELQSKAAGRLQQFGALADLVGVDLGSGSASVEAIRPDLYPDVLTSTPFLLYVAQQPVVDQDNKKWALQEFLMEKSMHLDDEDKAKTRLPLLFPNKLVKLNQNQKKLTEDISERLNSELDKKSGIIYITAKMPDPNVAAQLGQISTQYLQNYVTNYRTNRSRQNEQFLAQRVREAKSRYQQAELNWSAYSDENRYTITKVADIGRRHLEAEYMASQALYNDLYRQLEQAKLRVQEEKPVFQVLDPPSIPSKHSQPQRLLLIIGFAIAGAVVGLVVLFTRKIIAA